MDERMRKEGIDGGGSEGERDSEGGRGNYP